MDSKEELHKDRLFLAVILLVAALLRLDAIWASDFVLDADEAIVGLMAKHMLEGGGLPVFYYGQHYMGSLEAVLAALSFELFGMHSFALKLVPLIFSLILIVLCYLLTREIWNREAARITALLTALAPSALVLWSAKARGGFIEILVIGALALLFTVRWLKGKKASTVGIIPAAMILGVGWWVNNQIIYFMLPIGYAVLSKVVYLEDADLIEKLRKGVSLLIFGLTSFFFGSLPYWIYNFNHDFASFAMFSGSSFDDILKHSRGFFSVSLPILLGARQFWAEEDHFGAASLLVYVLYALIGLSLIAGRVREIARLFVLKLDYQKPVEILFLLLCSCAAVFIYSSYGWLVQAPRYLLPIYVALFPLLGIALNCMQQRAQFLSRLLLFAILLVNVFSSYPGRRAIPGEPFVYQGERVSRNHEELIAWLRKKDIHWVRTNYWIGYKLAFETKEDVRFVVFQEPLESRIELYEEEGVRYGLERMPFLLTPKQGDVVKRGLTRLGIAFDEEQRSGYVILYNLQKPYRDLKLIQGNMQAVSSEKPELANQAIDGSVQTRWPSAKPQYKGMQFQVSFAEPHNVRGIVYCLGEWAHDYPRGLEIYAIKADGSEDLVLSSEDYAAIGYLAYSHADCEDDFIFYLKPTLAKGFRFVQTGQHPILDWSIAELRFYE